MDGYPPWTHLGHVCLGSQTFFITNDPPANSLEINVVAKQWMWKVQHPEGQLEIDELHIPVGRPVKLTMTSQDVIHDFFVPAFRVKKDVLPGRYTTALVRGDRARGISFVLLAILRHPTFFNDRPDCRDASDRVPGMA